MKLLAPKRYYALNDRTVDFLMKGDIDMGPTTSEKAEGVKESDSEVIDLLGVGKEIGFIYLRKIRQELEAHSSHT